MDSKKAPQWAHDVLDTLVNIRHTGYLAHPLKRRPYIVLYTCGFSISDVNWLIEQVNSLGFKATKYSSRNSIYISTYSTKDFLNYIGKCPIKCYQYKWNYNEEDK